MLSLGRVVGGVAAEANEPDGVGDEDADALPMAPGAADTVRVEEIDETVR